MALETTRWDAADHARLVDQAKAAVAASGMSEIELTDLIDEAVH
jgi:hypothetical protein